MSEGNHGERQHWTSRPAFIMAVVGSAVGLGNMWRFPYVVAKHGGGAFLIPYFVALFVAGIPIMMLEMGLGQMTQRGAPAALARINKRLEWIGWWGLLVGSVISFYYAVVMSWCWNYVVHSFWIMEWGWDTATFFKEEVLHLSQGPQDVTQIVWPIVFGLAITWLCIFLIICKGVKVVSKVVMVTVPLPVLLLVILFIRGVSLPGAGPEQGLAYFLNPDWGKLFSDPDVWLDAFGQVFFSLSLGFGIMIAYASYEARRAEVTNNAVISSLADCATSFFAGFAVFSTLGFLAAVQGTDVADIAKDGPILAFVTYPAAIYHMPGLQWLLSLALFLALLSLGIDSAFSIVEGAVTGLADKWGVSQRAITGGFCLLGFFMGLPFCTDAGLFWLDIVDHWMNRYGLVAVGLAECLAVSLFFGVRRFRRFINDVSEIRVGRWWDVLIGVVTPACLAFFLIWNLVRSITQPYPSEKGAYPSWTILWGGWVPVLLVIVVAVGLMVVQGKQETADGSDVDG